MKTVEEYNRLSKLAKKNSEEFNGSTGITDPVRIQRIKTMWNVRSLAYAKLAWYA
jgi:hypothetical protein